MFTVTCKDSVGVGLMGQCNTIRSGSFGCLLLPLSEGAVGVCLMDQCDKEWFLRLFTVTCKGTVDVCLMDQCDKEWFLRLFTVASEGAVGVSLMDQCNTVWFLRLLLYVTCDGAVDLSLMD